MASIKDVAKLAGVGVGTVSRVINNSKSVSEATRERVLWAIKQLDYVPNEVARNFKKQSSQLIGIMVPTVAHPFFSKLVYYVETELYKYDYKLLVCNSETDKEKELQYIDMLRKNQVAGIIVISYHDFYNKMKIDFPIITIDRYISPDIPHVSSDNYMGGVLATEALIKGGCKKIAYLGGGSLIQTSVTKRKEAFIDVAKKYNIPYVTMEEIVPLNHEYRLVKKFLDLYPDVDGVFTSTDMFAASLIKELNYRGYSVPRDVQVIGFDGIQDNDLFHPVISTIVQPVEKIAQTSVQLLLDSINQKDVPKENILDIEYRKGETSLF